MDKSKLHLIIEGEQQILSLGVYELEVLLRAASKERLAQQVIASLLPADEQAKRLMGALKNGVKALRKLSRDGQFTLDNSPYTAGAIQQYIQEFIPKYGL